MRIGRRKQTELDDRRRKVAQLYLRRVPMGEIATQVNVHKSTITRDLQHLSREWLAESMTDTKILKARELAELDEMEYDCALQFSAKKHVEWTHARLRIKQRRAKMVGLDDPEVHQIVGADGGPIEHVLSGAEIARDVLNDPVARKAGRTLTDRLSESFAEQDDKQPHVSGNGQPG